ncbi:hypothetical protein ACFSQT_14780 [Mesorhizobium calcicola]|uniref:Uncharacterized protein n=1 Tax=Mesorhizobium calcicola TaxID=1300310 RepID=A0ABW4WDU0_9HYPH
MIIDAAGDASGRATSRQRRVAGRRSGPPASIALLPYGRHAIADINRKSKSP